MLDRNLSLHLNLSRLFIARQSYAAVEAAMQRISAEDIDLVEQHHILRAALRMPEEIPWVPGLDEGELGSLVSDLKDLLVLRSIEYRPERVVCDIGGADGVTAIALQNILGAESSVVVEKSGALVSAGRDAASRNMQTVSFQHCDARAADYRNSNFFYLYCPFGEHTTRAVLNRILEHRQGKGEILFCTNVIPDRWMSSFTGIQLLDGLPHRTCLRLWKANI
ncbi:MAG: hypothetical protein J5J00_15810 [Deltaproteobacteria bacterium]|nr:hypothetical protein [Deltaproteobacteria bacterium]